MAQLGTLSIDFLVNLQNSLQQVGQLENRIEELERAARDSRRAVDDIGNSRIGNIAGAFDSATEGIGRFRNGLQGVLSGQGGLGDLVTSLQGIPPQALLVAGSVIAITGAVAGLGIAISSSLSYVREQGDELDKTSQKLGVNVEALQGLRYAAGLSGIEADKLNDSFKEINNTLGEGKEGEKAKKFAELGVSLTDVTGKMKTADEILIDSADAFAKMGSDTERSIMAMQLFGEEGKELVPLLKQGSEAVREQIKEHKDLGGVMSKETTKQAAALSDSMAKLGVVFDGVKKALGEAFLPAATLVVDVVLEIAKAIKAAMPEGTDFKDLILNITKQGLRLLIQGIEATIKQVNNFGRILVVTAPLIAQVATNILVTANAALVAVNALDILQGFIRVGVLTVLEAMVKGVADVTGALGKLAATAGLDSLASDLAGAENSIRGMGSALAGLSSDAMAGISQSAANAKSNIDDAIKAATSYGDKVKAIQEAGQSVANIDGGGIVSGAKAIVDSNKALQEAVEENTAANNKNTDKTEENTKETKGSKAALKTEAPRVSSPLSAFEKIAGKQLDLEAGFSKSDALKQMLAGPLKEIEELDKKILQEKKKQSDLNKKINKTQGERQQKLLQQAEAEKEIAFLRDKNILLDSEELSISEKTVDLRNRISENAQKKAALDERAAELTKKANAIQALQLGGLIVSGAMAGVAGGVTGAAAGAALGPVGAVVGGIGGAIAGGAGAGILQKEVTEPLSNKTFTELTDLLTVQEELSNIKKIQGSYDKENLQLAEQISKHAERKTTVDKEMLANQGKAQKLAEEAAGLGATEQKLTDLRAQSQQSILNIEAQIAEKRQKIAETEAGVNSAQAKYLNGMGLKLEYLSNEAALVGETNAMQQQRLELRNNEIAYELAMMDLQDKKLEGIEYEVAAQEIINEKARNEYEIRQRTLEATNSATEAFKAQLQTTREIALALANREEIAQRELLMMRTSSEYKKAELELSFKMQELQNANLTATERELADKKALLEYEEAITKEHIRRLEMTSQGIGGIGSLGSQFSGMMEKIGFSEESARVIEEISGGLGGVATGVSGVARLMAGDIVGGITGIASGVMSLFESVWDIFDDDDEEEKKKEFEDLESIVPDRDSLRQQAEEFARAFVDEQEKRLQRPIQITVDARGALVGDDTEVARALGNLLEGEMGRRIGNINVPRGF